jgi:hypothetical protein
VNKNEDLWDPARARFMHGFPFLRGTLRPKQPLPDAYFAIVSRDGLSDHGKGAESLPVNAFVLETNPPEVFGRERFFRLDPRQGRGSCRQAGAGNCRK